MSIINLTKSKKPDKVFKKFALKKPKNTSVETLFLESKRLKTTMKFKSKYILISIHHLNSDPKAHVIFSFDQLTISNLEEGMDRLAVFYDSIRP